MSTAGGGGEGSMPDRELRREAIAFCNRELDRDWTERLADLTPASSWCR